jgi:hypothetical protein
MNRGRFNDRKLKLIVTITSQMAGIASLTLADTGKFIGNDGVGIP